MAGAVLCACMYVCMYVRMYVAACAPLTPFSALVVDTVRLPLPDSSHVRTHRYVQRSNTPPSRLRVRQVAFAGTYSYTAVSVPVQSRLYEDKHSRAVGWLAARAQRRRLTLSLLPVPLPLWYDRVLPVELSEQQLGSVYLVHHTDCLACLVDDVAELVASQCGQ